MTSYESNEYGSSTENITTSKGISQATLGTLIQQARQATGLSQRELAALIGIDHTYISKIENDAIDYTPKLTVLELLANRLGLALGIVLQAAGILPTSTLLMMQALYKVQGDTFVQAIADMYAAQFGNGCDRGVA